MELLLSIISIVVGLALYGGSIYHEHKLYKQSENKHIKSLTLKMAESILKVR